MSDMATNRTEALRRGTFDMRGTPKNADSTTKSARTSLIAAIEEIPQHPYLKNRTALAAALTAYIHAAKAFPQEGRPSSKFAEMGLLVAHMQQGNADAATIVAAVDAQLGIKHT